MTLAINLLQKYIRHRKRNIIEQVEIADNPELYSDVIWSGEKVKLLEAEIEQLQLAITKLQSK